MCAVLGLLCLPRLYGHFMDIKGILCNICASDDVITYASVVCVVNAGRISNKMPISDQTPHVILLVKE